MTARWKRQVAGIALALLIPVAACDRPRDRHDRTTPPLPAPTAAAPQAPVPSFDPADDARFRTGPCTVDPTRVDSLRIRLGSPWSGLAAGQDVTVTRSPDHTDWSIAASGAELKQTDAKGIRALFAASCAPVEVGLYQRVAAFATWNEAVASSHTKAIPIFDQGATVSIIAASTYKTVRIWKVTAGEAGAKPRYVQPHDLAGIAEVLPPVTDWHELPQYGLWKLCGKLAAEADYVGEVPPPLGDTDPTRNEASSAEVYAIAGYAVGSGLTAAQIDHLVHLLAFPGRQLHYDEYTAVAEALAAARCTR